MARPANLQRWTSLTFLHWRYDPAVVARHLPAGVEIDTYDGAAWVSLTPFELSVRPPAGPGRLVAPETNVRTYVRRGERHGIWFFSLDVGGLVLAAGARLTYGLPYFWSAMSLERNGKTLHYRCRRRLGPLAGHEVTVSLGAKRARPPDEPLARFLTARWRLYVKRGPLLLEAPVEHPAFEFADVRLLEARQTMLGAAGLPDPEGEPVAHHVAAVPVRVGAPRLAEA